MRSQACAAVSSEYLFARLHAIWAASLQGDALRSLIESRAESALHRVLNEWGVDPADRTRVQKRLFEHLIDHLGRIMTLCDPNMAAWYSVHVERFFFENLKTVLHYRYFPERDVDIHLLLVESPALPPLDPQALLEAPTVHRFYHLLPPFHGREAFLAILVELDDSKDIFRAEARIDRLYLQQMLSVAQALPGAEGEIAEELVRTEIDVSNALALLRNVSIYHLAPDLIEGILHPEGQVGLETWRRLTGAASVEAVREGLPAGLRNTLRGLDPGALHLWENALWNLLWRRAWTGFRDFGDPPKSIVVYPYLKWFQVLNINRVYEGFHFKLDSADVLEMMIGM